MKQNEDNREDDYISRGTRPDLRTTQPYGLARHVPRPQRLPPPWAGPEWPMAYDAPCGGSSRYARPA
eukprot:4474272-Prymnesium_polylepis.1